MGITNCNPHFSVFSGVSGESVSCVNFCVYVNQPSKTLLDLIQIGIAIQRVEAFRKTLHVAVELRMGDGRINLRGAYVFMPQQFADGLDRHSLRKRDRRGEGVACRMERDVPWNARQGHNAFETDVAPAVARQAEYPCISLYWFVFQQNGVRNREDTHVDRRPGLAAGRVDPQLFTVLLDMLRGKRAEIDVGKSGETTEHKRVAYQL